MTDSRIFFAEVPQDTRFFNALPRRDNALKSRVINSMQAI